MPLFEGDLEVDGTSLLTFGCIVDFSGIFSEAPLRGENLTIPGLAGEVHVPKVRGAYDFTVPMTFATASLMVPTHSETLEKVTDLRALLDSSAAPLELTRVSKSPADVFVREVCLADYTSGLELELVGFRHGRVAIVLRNLSGGWVPE